MMLEHSLHRHNRSSKDFDNTRVFCKYYWTQVCSLLCLTCVCVSPQPEQITRRRWLRFLPFWPSRLRLLIDLLLLKGPVLPAAGPQGCAPRPAAPPSPHWPCLPGTHDWGGLQLPPCQQLRPLLPSHAALYQRTSAHMRSSWISTHCFAKDSTDSCECFLFTPCPKATNCSLLGSYMHDEVIQRWYEDFSLTNIAHPLTWSHLNPLNALSGINGPSSEDPPIPQSKYFMFF